MNNDFDKVRTFLLEHRLLYAAVTGLDKKPQVHPVRLCYEEGGAFYFAEAKCETSYGEISMSPVLSMCACDVPQGIVFRMKGAPVFTEDEEVVLRCMSEDGILRERWGSEPGMIIAWFLKDAACEFISLKDGSRQVIDLGTPGGALVGITIKKDKELRDRLISVLNDREACGSAAGDEHDIELQKLYDGALMYFAETAKALWPRMDIGPIELSAVFETYDEREKYTGAARKLIGNAVIDKPEDITYWLNKETLKELPR